MLSIYQYKYLLEHMSAKITNGQKKPNKAIMLLSVMDLIRCGYVRNNRIYIEDTIQEAFEYNWHMYVNSNSPSPWTPFWHLKNEPFWHFCPINSLEEIDILVKPGETATVNKMKSIIKYAYLDSELFNYFNDNYCRNKLIEALIGTYIPPYIYY